MSEHEKNGPINMLKNKLELLTLKASLRYNSSKDFASYNADEHIYTNKLRAVSYDPDGAIAAARAAAAEVEAKRPKRRPASALASTLDAVLNPPEEATLRLQTRYRTVLQASHDCMRSSLKLECIRPILSISSVNRARDAASAAPAPPPAPRVCTLLRQ